MTKRITCINKQPTHADPYHHITQVGVGGDGGWNEKLLVTEVIRQLQMPTGDRYYVRGTDGSEADVRIGSCPHCAKHQYIRTTPDGSTSDNLLTLSECSA